MAETFTAPVHISRNDLQRIRWLMKIVYGEVERPDFKTLSFDEVKAIIYPLVDLEQRLVAEYMIQELHHTGP